jgi:LruC domain-containing protein
MKKLFTLIITAGVLVSCSKRENTGPVINNPANATSLAELTIPEAFNWSSSEKGALHVTLNPDINNFVIEGQVIQIIDVNGKVLDRAVIKNNTADFYMNVPQNNDGYRLYLPATGDSKEITSFGNVQLDVITDFMGDFDALTQRASNSGSSGKKSSKGKTAGVNLLTNGDFEINDFGTYWGGASHTLTGKWYNYYCSNCHQWKNISGNRVYKAKSSNSDAGAIQSVPVNGGDLYTMSAVTSGLFCYYVYFKDANGDYISHVGYNPTNNLINETGTIPANAAYALIYVHGPKNNWIDDVVFSTDPGVVDTDNDGVADDNDDYPSDPARAYTANFPTSGYQTVSFEDLWPARGDFDLNDMVLTNNVVYTLDANNDPVDATFTISLDAVGSGFSNGLAIVFTDDSYQPISQNIISSVTGDASVDPNVTNGHIIFNDVYTAQSTYYQNNGVGPSEAADVFTFTVNFNNNAGNQSLVPDVYIFRTSNRGLEVHLDGFRGTSAADPSLNGTIDDINGNYSTANGLPWALEIVTPNKSYQHPLEKVDILVAYPQFQGWAESTGTQNTDWLDNPVLTSIFQ